MSTCLGIDYGLKRIGVAIAEKELRIAVPLQIFPNNDRIVDEILSVVMSRSVDCIVIGKSKNFQGNDNNVVRHVSEFESVLKKQLPSGVRIEYEDERYTTQAARRFSEKGAHVDASAAALILQSWLDRT
jgi:putative Holliday junction resolvase